MWARFEKIEEHLERVPLMDDTKANFEDVKTLIQNNLEQCVSLAEWTRINSGFMSDFKEQRKWNKNADRQFQDIELKFQSNTKILANKVSTKEMREIKAGLEQLPTIPEIREWKKKLKEDIDDFHADNR